MAMRRAAKIELTAEERKELKKLARSRVATVRLAERAAIVLAAADGKLNREIAIEVGVARGTVGTWRSRFLAGRVAALAKDRPRGGRPPAKLAEAAPRILHATLHEKPADATHWTIRTLAKHLGVSKSLVERTWKTHQLKPHLVKTFKVSNDPKFEEKVLDVVGLYLNPPEQALVLSVDEKSQIQALDRTQKSLPMFPGRLGTRTHDYQRNGTTTLFAAVDVKSGVAVGPCLPRRRHQEFLSFLKLIDRETQPELALHLIVDNYATHKHPKVKAWLKKRRRFHLHFIPTGSSWLNLVERWFRNLTERRIRRGVFRSVAELKAAIDSYLAAHNADPQGFAWRASAEKIIEKYRRAKAALQKINAA
jgi:transposase